MVLLVPGAPAHLSRPNALFRASSRKSAVILNPYRNLFVLDIFRLMFEGNPFGIPLTAFENKSNTPLRQSHPATRLPMNPIRMLLMNIIRMGIVHF